MHHLNGWAFVALSAFSLSYNILKAEKDSIFSRNTQPKRHHLRILIIPKLMWGLFSVGMLA